MRPRVGAAAVLRPHREMPGTQSHPRPLRRHNGSMTLDYLDFDYSEDADGTGTFDAMASAQPAQLGALQAEVARVLAWAHTRFPDGCYPLEDGGSWHYDLRGSQETSAPLEIVFDGDTHRLTTALGPPGPPRTTVSLSISGNAHFCAALRETFGLE